jgi:hypothetical protein
MTTNYSDLSQFLYSLAIAGVSSLSSLIFAPIDIYRIRKAGLAKSNLE